jgi:hypothetical protein
MVSIGPKRQQRTFLMGKDCQEWINPAFAPGKSNNELAYRVKVSDIQMVAILSLHCAMFPG